MNQIRPMIVAGVLASALLVFSCQRNADLLTEPSSSSAETSSSNEAQPAPEEPCNPTAYTITLESRTFVNGVWEWIWSIQNPNPGTGTNGTVQDLSHWGILASCIEFDDIVSAGYSNNGTGWHDFEPVYQVDKSQDCLAQPVLKFDFGTGGGDKSYYRLILNEEYPVGSTLGYYKSGRRTNCCFIDFTGPACDISL